MAPKHGATLRNLSTLEGVRSSMVAADVERGEGGGERPRRSADEGAGHLDPLVSRRMGLGSPLRSNSAKPDPAGGWPCGSPTVVEGRAAGEEVLAGEAAERPPAEEGVSTNGLKQAPKNFTVVLQRKLLLYTSYVCVT